MRVGAVMGKTCAVVVRPSGHRAEGRACAGAHLLQDDKELIGDVVEFSWG